MELDQQLCKNHLLLSALDPPHGADCRRIHRFVCLTVLLSSLLTLAAVWYGLVHSTSQYELITGTSVFRVHDVGVALVVALVSVTLAALTLEMLNCSKIKVFSLSLFISSIIELLLGRLVLFPYLCYYIIPRRIFTPAEKTVDAYI